VGPIGHAASPDRTQPRSAIVSVKRLTAPSGSVDGGSPALPPPSARSPHLSGISTVPDPSRTEPQSAPDATVLESSSVSGGSGSSVVVDDVVVEVVVVVEPGSEVVVGGGRVDVVVVVGPVNWWSVTVPERLAAPGPGSEAAPSISGLPVAGMQNADASV